MIDVLTGDTSLRLAQKLRQHEILLADPSEAARPASLAARVNSSLSKLIAG
jgi:hypothetical protein